MIVHDYIPIAQRMAQLEQERQAAQFVLPDGVHIVPWYIPNGLLAHLDMCFILNGQRLRLVKSRTGGFTTYQEIDMISYLRQYFPSLRKVPGVFELELAPDDIARLIKLLPASPAA